MELNEYSDTIMCRVCTNNINLIDLSLPENDFIIKNLESLVFVEVHKFFFLQNFQKKKYNFFFILD